VLDSRSERLRKICVEDHLAVDADYDEENSRQLNSHDFRKEWGIVHRP
jgi:hypothetical protein